MLLFLLFASAAAQCETGTCGVCKNMTGCDWYGFDCYNKTSSAVTTLKLTATATCDVCQAGNCGECTWQDGCSWFASDIPGAPGKCAMTNSSQTLYTELEECPPCNGYTSCDACSKANATCGWYELAGVAGGKCREAAPSFAYSKTKLGYCSGDPCAGQKTCNKCEAVTLNNDTNLCAWYTSKQPAFYDSKCGAAQGGALSSAFYNPTPSCPVCSALTCVDCKADAQCKWVALDAGVLGTSFGQCMKSSETTPTGKSIIATCPATCNVHSCKQCQSNADCSWFTGSSVIDDSCDLTKDASAHFGQTKATTCPACGADRCFECNGLDGCGWYAKKVLGQIVLEGCYSKTSFPSGRELIANTDSKCKGVPSSSASVAVSMVVLAALALVA